MTRKANKLYQTKFINVFNFEPILSFQQIPKSSNFMQTSNEISLTPNEYIIAHQIWNVQLFRLTYEPMKSNEKVFGFEFPWNFRILNAKQQANSDCYRISYF